MTFTVSPGHRGVPGHDGESVRGGHGAEDAGALLAGEPRAEPAVRL